MKRQGAVSAKSGRGLANLPEKRETGVKTPMSSKNQLPPYRWEKRMLLKINGRPRSASFYPTMLFITRGLDRESRNLAFCFQYDKRLKTSEFRPNAGRTHDVYDGQGLALDRSLAVLHYLVENKRAEKSAHGGVRASKPTMCMKRNGVSPATGIPSSGYVIESRVESSLAAKRKGSVSHDVDHGKGFKAEKGHVLFGAGFGNASLHVASALALAVPRDGAFVAS